MRYWRNGSPNPISKFWIWFRYVWLVPAVPIVISSFVWRLDNPRFASDSYFFQELLAMNSVQTNTILIVLGVLLWLHSVKTTSQPIFEINEQYLVVNKSAFLKEQFSFAAVKKIKQYNLGVGTMFDIQSDVGTNFRCFCYLAKSNKDSLSIFFRESGIRIG